MGRLHKRRRLTHSDCVFERRAIGLKPIATESDLVTTPDDCPPAAVDAPRAAPKPSLNVPNAITASRLLLALILFALIDIDGYWITSAVLFIVAASTDFLDGYIARRTGQVTVLGRILDPFVDKIIVCGAFLFLVAHPESGVCAWTAFVVFAREMFVTSLRTFLEIHRVDFSASWVGKVKMIVQCVAVPTCLLSMSTSFERVIDPSVMIPLRDGIVLITVAVTVISGMIYAVRAVTLIRSLNLVNLDTAD